MADFIPTDEQWEKMKKFIKGNKYKKEDFFVFETLAVGDKIVPNRYMRLTPELLLTMRDDAQAGVSLMLNHNWSQSGVQSIPIGKVFDARIGGPSQEGETTTLYTTQYILRDDSKVDGYSKNDIINLIESGIIADTSVGWGTTRDAYKCNICGHSIYDYRNCEHIPGRKYIVNEDTNEVKECIVEAHSPKEKHAGNNVLMENSVVFDGAYPNAVIQSAIGEEINTPTGKFVKLEGKQELNEKDLIFGYSAPGGNVNLLYKPTLEKGGLDIMNKENEGVTELENNVTDTNTSIDNEGNVAEETPVIETVTETVTEQQATEPADEGSATEPTESEPVAENLYTEKDILNKFDNICNSVDELVKMAKEGLANRNMVIEKALSSGVHSMGNAFNKEVFVKTFANMETNDIEEMGKTWETQAEKQFSKVKVSKQEFSKNDDNEIRRMSLKQFKTDNY